jgi:hypothetical protein
MTPDKELAAVTAEMRERKINHGRNTSPTLHKWADRLEAIASEIARLRSERDEAVREREWLAMEGAELKRDLRSALDERDSARNTTRRQRAELERLRAVPEALASGIGGAGEVGREVRAFHHRIVRLDGTERVEVTLTMDMPFPEQNYRVYSREPLVFLHPLPPARPSFDAGWKPPEPLSSEHPLECLIVLEAWRQSDGDWWMECSDSFIDGDRPLAYMADTPENRAALKAAPGTERSRSGGQEGG